MAPLRRPASVLALLVVVGALAALPAPAALARAIDRTPGPNRISGSPDPDVLHGDGGADLAGAAGADQLVGDTGPTCVPSLRLTSRGGGLSRRSATAARLRPLVPRAAHDLEAHRAGG